MFLTVTDSLLKLFGYLEHCVYSERMCYCPNLYNPIKWYVYARNCMGPSYFWQERMCYCPNLYSPIKWYVYARNCMGPSNFRQNEITRRIKYYLWAYIQE